ncbi:hypothetical protein FXB40_29850 [Bradyrhizobium rifense]|uniref:PhnA-like protein n=1 Tax=Bradyrhizobium rifense TaxID=515499 RepID=A0A5D3KDB6_9BRAD|nr:hypothetical protein [Bradyrhizobium rifense]TYL90837.1 hypothetical protein FXB40_29850 [Bradyrhizobium rifense]
MSMESLPPAPRADIEAYRADRGPRYLQWSPILLGAFAATALSFVLVTFGASVGLGVTSASPTWRDASAALWILSGIYLILQAILSFGLGGYVTGWVRTPAAPGGPVEHTEQVDGLHGLAVWALAVVMGAILATLLGAATLSRNPAGATSARTSAAEPLLSYELDRLYRAGRRAPTTDLSSERAEAGRILLTSSSHDGMSTDDRSYLIQQVAGATGLAATDAERRVDTVIANAKTAIARSRRSTIILAFSVATAILLGAIAAWAAACAGGRHRDGEPLPQWMVHSNSLDRRRTVLP